MLQSYVGAGLDPARFWEITPRLTLLEMQGAKHRIDRERELIWWGAMLPYLEKRVDLDRFMGRPVDHRARAAAVNAAWDKVDQALARH